MMKSGNIVTLYMPFGIKKQNECGCEGIKFPSFCIPLITYTYILVYNISLLLILQTNESPTNKNNSLTNQLLQQ